MQVWHEDIMDEPFYESIGPDYIEVRKDVKKRFYNPNGLCIVSVQPKYISLVDKIIEEIIPENRNDFGSYRGYAMSGMCYNIVVDVLRKYNAYIKIEKELLPYVKYKLYNPDNGWIMKKAMRRFNNNKLKSIKKID
tara:strand:+ start:1751 stop:2158 length:408 start_codon:yes stop_codon:yes gene_type:complete